MLSISSASPTIASNQSLSRKRDASPAFQGHHQQGASELSLETANECLRRLARRENAENLDFYGSKENRTYSSSDIVDEALLSAIYRKSESCIPGLHAGKGKARAKTPILSEQDFSASEYSLQEANRILARFARQSGAEHFDFYRSDKKRASRNAAEAKPALRTAPSDKGKQPLRGRLTNEEASRKRDAALQPPSSLEAAKTLLAEMAHQPLAEQINTNHAEGSASASKVFETRPALWDDNRGRRVQFTLASTENRVDSESPAKDKSTQAERDHKALMKAVCVNHVSALRELLRLQPDLNRAGGEGKTALNLAAEKGEVEAVTLLLDAGADPNIPDANGKRPIDWAIENRDYKMFETLVAGSPDHQELKADYTHAVARLSGMSGDDAAAQATNMLTAGINALSPEALSQVLSYQPRLNVPGDKDSDDATWPTLRNGATPLMRAAAKGNANGAKQLLKAGAPLNDRDRNNDTALEYARGKSHGLRNPYLSTFKLLFLRTKVQNMLDSGISMNEINQINWDDYFYRKLEGASFRVKNM